MVEDNLLGTASSASVRYRKTPDRSTVALGFRRPRLFAGRVGLALAYENRSDGRLDLWCWSSRSTRSPPPTGFASRRRTVTSGCSASSTAAQDAQDTLSRRYTLVRGVGGLGAAEIVATGSSGWASRPRSGGTTSFRKEPGLAVPPIGDRRLRPLSGLEPGEISGHPGRLRVRPGRGRGSGRDGAGRRSISRPKAFGYERNGIAPLVIARVGAKIPGRIRLSRGTRGRDVHLARVSIPAWCSSPRPACIKPTRGPRRHRSTSEAGWIENPLPGAEFDLGLGSGPRAFRSHAFTGDRTVFATAEYRVTVADDFLGSGGAGHRGIRGPRRGLVCRDTAPTRAGMRGSGSGSARAAHRIRRRCGSTWRVASETMRRRRLGRDRREGVRLLPGRETGALTRRRRSGSGPRPPR